VEPAIERVPISSLQDRDSPRLAGIDEAHARLLAGNGAVLAPILVDCREMRIIDGRHRVRAAQLRGQGTVTVELVDIPEDLVFGLAVESNVRHGLPLSFSDRLYAAERLIASYPGWSDRAIGRIAGIAAGTVAAVRSRRGNSPVGTRLGLDGRRRPEDPVAGRQRAADVIAESPGASLRQVAARADVSQATVRDVRQRLKRGEDPVPNGLRQRSGRSTGRSDSAPLRSGRSARVQHRRTMLDGLRHDPALRFTESGRAMLRWLTAVASLGSRCEYFVSRVPADCRGSVAELARAHAQEWLLLAEHLERQAASTTDDRLTRPAIRPSET
jgi:ParB-like chromosome segregation protein Spo0J